MEIYNCVKYISRQAPERDPAPGYPFEGDDQSSATIAKVSAVTWMTKQVGSLHSKPDYPKGSNEAVRLDEVKARGYLHPGWEAK